MNFPETIPRSTDPLNDLPNYIQLFTNLADSLGRKARRTIKTHIIPENNILQKQKKKKKTSKGRWIKQ